MFNIVTDDTKDIITQWTPKMQYENENQYRDDLLSYLNENFSSKYRLYNLRGEVHISKETGEYSPYIEINKNIGIELKKDLDKKSEVDRLIVQLVGFKREYSDILVVLVGMTNRESLEKLKMRIRDLPKDYVDLNTPNITIMEKE